MVPELVKVDMADALPTLALNTPRLSIIDPAFVTAPVRLAITSVPEPRAMLLKLVVLAMVDLFSKSIVVGAAYEVTVMTSPLRFRPFTVAVPVATVTEVLVVGAWLLLQAD